MPPTWPSRARVRRRDVGQFHVCPHISIHRVWYRKVEFEVTSAPFEATNVPFEASYAPFEATNATVFLEIIDFLATLLGKSDGHILFVKHQQ